MTTPCYPQGCLAGSQVHGDAGSARSFFYVNMNNGNVNNNNANNRLRVRPVRRGVPASQCSVLGAAAAFDGAEATTVAATSGETA